MTPTDVFNNVLIQENLGSAFATDHLKPDERVIVTVQPL
jgi:hypothetical protein